MPLFPCARFRVLAPMSRFALFLFLLTALGCAPKARQPLRDLATIPQSVSAHLDPATRDTPLLSPDQQARFYARFLEEHFGPWHRDAPRWGADHVFWGLDVFSKKDIHGENTLLRDPSWLETMRQRSATQTYPMPLGPAIATVNTSMRVLPTSEPVFYDFSRAGEGFPFDYLQNSGVWAGTPLFVSHVSSDGAWYLCETRFAYGWLPAHDVALVSPEFRSVFETSQLLAVTDDHLPISDDPGLHLGMGRIGMVLPTDDRVCPVGTFAALFPVRDDHGMAQVRRVFLPTEGARPMPLPPTPAHIAALADRLMGQSYGWGGLYGKRDCSATLLDLYAPFGLFLPRNSKQQAMEGGRFIYLSGLPAAEREDYIIENGVPFLTLVRKPGHIMLYIGTQEMDGRERALMLHTTWGLKTKTGDTYGRYVIGSTVITTLTPGMELPDLARPDGILLETVQGITRLDLPAESAN